MATNLDNLKTRRDAVISQLASMTSTSVGGGPDYSVPEQSMQQVAYRKSLYEELELLNKQIAIAEGPWEVRSVGVA